MRTGARSSTGAPRGEPWIEKAQCSMEKAHRPPGRRRAAHRARRRESRETSAGAAPWRRGSPGDALGIGAVEKGVAPGDELGRGSEAAPDDESGGGAVETGAARRCRATRDSPQKARCGCLDLVCLCMYIYIYIYISPSGPTDQNRICNISSIYKSKRENRKQAQQKVQSGVPFAQNRSISFLPLRSNRNTPPPARLHQINAATAATQDSISIHAKGLIGIVVRRGVQLSGLRLGRPARSPVRILKNFFLGGCPVFVLLRARSILSRYIV
jgi:hypothetical protein